MKYLIFIIIYFLLPFNCTNLKFSVWGPGLKPDIIVMPARYFFIKVLHENNTHKYTVSPDDFTVEVKGKLNKDRSCRAWTNILLRVDGLIIVRYKLYDSCENFVLSIKYKNEHIAQSPYVFNTKVYAEDCDCPKGNLKNFIESWDCGDIPKQITKDLEVFSLINWDNIRTKLITKFNQPNSISICHYVLKNNDIYRTCYGKYVGFKMFMDSILMSLKRKSNLPDMEFFVNLGDWPLVNDESEMFPIFAWCGSHDTYDIVMPTYDITESTIENMGRVTLDMLSVQGNVKNKWEDKLNTLFWRGRDSSRERLKLIDISRKHPELFNVSLTNFFFFRDKEAEYGPKTDYVSFFSFFDYKYQLALDGTVAPYRFPYLLIGGSLILKQYSKYYEHFYNELIPNVHYVPIERDIENLVEKLEWAKNNDNLSKTIAQAGQKFAFENLLPKNIYCYHAFLLHNFSKKIVSPIKVLPNMEKLEMIKTSDCNCDFIKDEL